MVRYALFVPRFHGYSCSCNEKVRWRHLGGKVENPPGLAVSLDTTWVMELLVTVLMKLCELLCL